MAAFVALGCSAYYVASDVAETAQSAASATSAAEMARLAATASQLADRLSVRIRHRSMTVTLTPRSALTDPAYAGPQAAKPIPTANSH